MTGTTAETTTEHAPVIKEREGVVVKNKMQKTVVVEVTRRVRHPKYFKFVTHRARYQAHDEANTCKVGDVVILQETRPLSKNKRWRVKEVIRKAPSA